MNTNEGSSFSATRHKDRTLKKPALDHQYYTKSHSPSEEDEYSHEDEGQDEHSPQATQVTGHRLAGSTLDLWLRHGHTEHGECPWG